MEIRRINWNNDHEGESQSAPFAKRFDYSPPDGIRHPDDKTVDVAGLVLFGILSEEAVKERRAFTREVRRIPVAPCSI
jgi:hypothetical protein